MTPHADDALTCDLAALGYAQAATLRTPAHDDPEMAGKPWTEDAMLRVLWRHFASQSWAAVPQVTVAERDLNLAHQGLSQWDARTLPVDERTDRRIDMLAVRKPRRPGLGLVESLAIEVKVSRADFLSDVRNPAKQNAWRLAATRHTYAVPAGLVSPDEIPEGSGLLAVKHGPRGWGEVEWQVRAPYPEGHRPQLPPRVVMGVLYRAAALEAHTRGWSHSPEAAGTPEELRAAVKAANTAAERDRKAKERAEGQLAAWKGAYALLAKTGHPCGWCGQPVKPLNPGAEGFRSWRHIDQGDDAPCALVETAELERLAQKTYDAASVDERGWKVRAAIRHWPGRVDVIERDPWQAFMPYDYGHPPKLQLRGARPADVLPQV